MIGIEPLEVSANLSSPVIVSGYLTFDAVLYAALGVKYDLTRKAAVDAMPIAKRDGVALASAAIHEVGANFEASFIAIFRMQDWVNSQGEIPWVSTARGGGDHRAIDTERGPYQAEMGARNAIETPRILWRVLGNKDAVVDLLSVIEGVGAKTNAGYGAVSAWSVKNEGIRWEDPITCSQGFPLRPVPVETWRAWGGKKDAPQRYVAWRAPYWATTQRLCVVPPMTRIRYPKSTVSV